MHIGEKIKKRRIDLGYSQEKLAKKLGYKSKTSIHKIEAGINDITQSKVIEFAKILKTTPAYLMNLEIEISPKSFGEKIKKLRKELGLSLKEIANHLEVSESLISRYESNEVKNMGIDKIIPLAQILQTNPNYIIGWGEITENKNTIEIENLDILLTKSELDEFNKIVSINQILFLNKIKDKKYINLFKDVLLKIFVYSKEDKKGE